MPYIFYRSYDDDISNKGFEAWVQLELPDIKKLVTRFNGIYTAPIQFKEVRAKWLSDAIFKYNRKTLNLDSLGELIKSKRDHSTVQTSTDITNDGGGRGAKHLYQITCPKTLYLVDPETGRSTLAQDANSFRVVVRAKLVLDATSLANASLVALALVGNEVAFLTSIPKAWISRVF